MRVIQCPEVYTPQQSNEIVLFLGGGISNCPDWQREMISRFTGCSDRLVLINPRRSDFDITDPTSSQFQIEWEFSHIHQSHGMLFWFPWNTLCPITLFELGVQVGQSSHPTIFVGCHPAYPRAFDVKHQLKLATPTINVRDNFTDVVDDVIQWFEVGGTACHTEA